MTVAAIPAKILRRYAITYFGIILAFGLIAAFALAMVAGLFLWRTGELSALPDIVTRQLQTGAVYGSAVHDDSFEYKLQLVAAAKPTIIALGSSRVLQFRQAHFTETFINAGRAMTTPAEGIEFLAKLLPRHKPKFVILGVDFWWFNPNWPYPGRHVRRDELDLAALKRVNQWLLDGKITIPNMWRVVFQGDNHNSITQADNIGVAAIKRGYGYWADGSRDYGLRYFGVDPAFDDAKFGNTLSRIANGVSQFTHSEVIAAGRFAALDELLELLMAADITPIIILTPLAKRVLDRMVARSPAYAYISAFRDRIKTMTVERYDFSDPGSLGSDDCEFVDGVHGGEIVYQRILAEIVRRNPQSAIAPLVSSADLRRSIKQSSGRTLSAESAAKYSLAETDFLGLGCVK